MSKNEIKTFEDLETWQTAHKFALGIYRITKIFPKVELYGIVNQLRRAVSSTTSNIAEGFSRYYYNDKIRFYYNARGSLSEVRNYLILSKDLKYITKEKCQSLLDDAERVLKMINGLIRSIEKQK